MKRIFFIAAMLCIVIFISCNRSNKKEEVFGVTTAAVELAPAAATDAVANGEQQIPIGDLPPSTTDSTMKAIPAKMVMNNDWDKKIIKTASLKLEVPDFKKYNDNLYKTVKQLGGYVAQEEQNLYPEKNETVITIKVPVAQFESMMNELPGTDTKLVERKINSDDVTAKVIDTKSRLEAKKEMRQKYLEFLKQSKNMKEVLEVQEEINSIQEEMEAAAGQINYLTHQSAMSTINLTFYQLLPGYKPDPVENPSFATRVANAFRSGTVWMADLFVALMSVWPLLLVVIILFFGWRKTRSGKMLTPVTQPANKNQG
ncbi:MAG: DUF4349 domain-containing protein [Ferruginibacter sp.]